MNKEVWLPIKGTNGIYEVSNYGRVHNTYTDRYLKPGVQGKGYLNVTLCVNGKRTTAMIHRLVANEFIRNWEGKPQVNHIDGDKENNRADNLEWVTNEENTAHAYATGSYERRKVKHDIGMEPLRKPVVAVNIKDGREKVYRSILEARKDLKTNHIHEVLTGKVKQSKGYTFRYAEGGDYNVL